MVGKNKPEGIYISFLRLALIVCSQALPQFSHPKSKRTYTFPSLVACCLLKFYIKNIDWRGLEELLNSFHIQKLFGWKKVLDHSTFYRAFQKLVPEMINSLFEKVISLLNPKAKIVCVDSTGIREDSDSFFEENFCQ